MTVATFPAFMPQNAEKPLVSPLSHIVSTAPQQGTGGSFYYSADYGPSDYVQ